MGQLELDLAKLQEGLIRTSSELLCLVREHVSQDVQLKDLPNVLHASFRKKHILSKSARYKVETVCRAREKANDPSRMKEGA